MSKRSFGWTILALALFSACAPARAAYQFTLLADRALGSPAINNAGHIAYYANSPVNGQLNLYFWDGTGHVAILNDAASTISSQPVINDNDRLAMSRTTSHQIMVWDPVNGPRELYPPTGNIVSGMNNAGTIVTTVLGSSGGEVWAGNGAPMTLVHSGSPDGIQNGAAAINDAGTIAIYDRNATLTSESMGYVSGGTFVPIASTATGYSTITRPSINNAGAIAFAALHAGDHLYRYANGILQDVTPQGFGHSGDVAISGLGDIVYHEITAGADRIRVGTNTVITRGDPLFGSTVSILQLGSDSINDAGQVVFQANLADGRSVAVLAQVPEPALALLVPAIMLLRNRRAHAG